MARGEPPWSMRSCTDRYRRTDPLGGFGHAADMATAGCIAALAGTRIAVTGGAGFIGSHAVDALGAAGAHVLVLDGLSTGRQHNIGRHASTGRTDLHVCDIRSRVPHRLLTAFHPHIVSTSPPSPAWLPSSSLSRADTLAVRFARRRQEADTCLSEPAWIGAFHHRPGGEPPQSLQGDGRRDNRAAAGESSENLHLHAAAHRERADDDIRGVEPWDHVRHPTRHGQPGLAVGCLLEPPGWGRPDHSERGIRAAAQNRREDLGQKQPGCLLVGFIAQRGHEQHTARPGVGAWSSFPERTAPR